MLHRYANMDYILLAAIAGISLAWILVSYDIACQWSKYFLQRMADYPEWMLVAEHVKWSFAIPKFHLPAHGETCQSPYSLNLLRWMARIDGEGIERIWSWINALAFSTREMGPGCRSDTMDAHWAAWNWRKIRGHGTF
jgi:hypothetical protein